MVDHEDHDNEEGTEKLAINEDVEVTTRSKSFITCTLTRSSISSLNNKNCNESKSSKKKNDAAGREGDVGKGKGSKREQLQREWDETCKKWGFVVVRQLTYEQNTFSNFGKALASNDATSSASATVSNNTCQTADSTVTTSARENVRNNAPVIMLNGIEALQIRDELVVSSVIRSSPAHSAGIRESDTIDALYGMKSPSLSLLFGIMRDSNTFQ